MTIEETLRGVSQYRVPLPLVMQQDQSRPSEVLWGKGLQC